tara:strand:- start:898 stop:4662 length:3765 start_codon:yes stop_codon:yes gene_type:complete
MSKIIRGAKGGRSRDPVRADDNLNSKEFATVQDLLSEGEIEGFATPSKRNIARNDSNYRKACLADIFLNNTPVLNVSSDLTNTEFTNKLNNLQDTDFSFQNVTFKPRFGTSNQSAVGNVNNNIFTKQSTSITPTHSNPIKKTGTPGPVDSPNITLGKDAVEVTITFAAFQKFENNGDISGTEVTLKIQRQINNGNFVDRVTDTIKGRSADPYSKEYRIDLPNNYTQAKIRVLRDTDDSNPDEIQDTFSVTRMEEISDDVRTYPNCAYSTLRLSSEQFSSVPQRAFRIRGIKVRIPGAGANGTNAPTVDPATGRIVYDDNYIFNGTMGAAVWCTCPAMILLDLLTNKRYGLGDHIAPDQSTDAKMYSNIDLFSYVQASRYANELVTDTVDGTSEARFSCNASIQGTAEAYTLINELAGIMRAFPIWQAGTITIAQDRPTNASYLFSLSNVTEAGFSYSGSSLRQRHSVVSVSYFNMDSREIDYEIYGDDDSDPVQAARIAKYGIVKKTVKAFGCTSRKQARRLAKAIVFSEEQEAETVTFTTSIDAGAIVRPGSVIAVADPVRGSQRRSGRIKTATTTSITVDNVKDLETFSGGNQKCLVLLPDGKSEEIATTNVDPATGVITLASALSQTPAQHSIWMLSSNDLKPQFFRVISVEEQENTNFVITGLTYIDGKYNNIELGEALPPRNISLLNALKAPPSGLGAEEKIVVINNLAVSKLIVSWQVRTGVSQYLVQYRFNQANWVSETVFRPDIEILNSHAGTYEIRVYSFNASLSLSNSASSITFDAKGKTQPPSAVQNLSYEPLTNKLVRLRWDLATDPDVLHGGRVYIRHSSRTDGSGTFQNSVDLIPAIAGNSTIADVPALEGEYILKFQDDGGRFSLSATSVIVDLPDIIDEETIVIRREDLLTQPFCSVSSSGACTSVKTNVSVVGDGLQLTDPATNLIGTYDFAQVIDLGAVYSLNLQRTIQAIGFALGGQTITATYVRTTATIDGQSQTVIEITSNGHGRSVGDYINFVAVTGGATDGVFEIKVITTNTFQFLATGSAISSSNCTFAFVNTIDQIIPTGSFWDNYATGGNFDGPAVDDVSASLSVNVTQSDPATAAADTYSGFQTFANGTYKGRGFKFRATLESESAAHNISVQELGFLAKFESRTERRYVHTDGTIKTEPIDSGTSSSGKDVTFANPFFTGTASLGGVNKFPPSIGITIVGAATGDYFVLSNVTRTGFNIKIKNDSQNPVFIDKKFTFQAVGYGKGV